MEFGAIRATVAAVALIAVLAVGGCSNSTSPDESNAVTADLEISPAQGTVLTDFVLDASGSSVASRALEFRWDWENDGTWDTDWSTESTDTRRFDHAPVTVAVQVTDGSDTDTAEADVTIDVRHGEILETYSCPVPELRGLGFDGTHLWGSV